MQCSQLPFIRILPQKESLFMTNKKWKQMFAEILRFK